MWWISLALGAPNGVVETLSLEEQASLGSACADGAGTACLALAAAVEHTWAAGWADAAVERGVPAPWRIHQAANLYELACLGDVEAGCRWMEQNRAWLRLPPSAPSASDQALLGCAQGDAAACGGVRLDQRVQICEALGGSPGDAAPASCALPWRVVAAPGSCKLLTSWGCFRGDSFFDGQAWRKWTPYLRPNNFLHPTVKPDDTLFARRGDTLVVGRQLWHEDGSTEISGLIFERARARPFSHDAAGLGYWDLSRDGLVLTTIDGEQVAAEPGGDWFPRPKVQTPTEVDADGWKILSRAPDGSTYVAFHRDHEHKRVCAADGAVLAELRANLVYLGPGGMVSAGGVVLALGERTGFNWPKRTAHLWFDPNGSPPPPATPAPAPAPAVPVRDARDAAVLSSFLKIDIPSVPGMTQRVTLREKPHEMLLRDGEGWTVASLDLSAPGLREIHYDVLPTLRVRLVDEAGAGIGAADIQFIYESRSWTARSDPTGWLALPADAMLMGSPVRQDEGEYTLGPSGWIRPQPEVVDDWAFVEEDGVVLAPDWSAPGPVRYRDVGHDEDVGALILAVMPLQLLMPSPDADPRWSAGHDWAGNPLTHCGVSCPVGVGPPVARRPGTPSFTGNWVRADHAREVRLGAIAEELRSADPSTQITRVFTQLESVRDRWHVLSLLEHQVPGRREVYASSAPETLSGAALATLPHVVVDADTVVVREPLSVYRRAP